MKRAAKILLAIDSIRDHLSDSEGYRMDVAALRMSVVADTGCNNDEYRHAMEDLRSDGQVGCDLRTAEAVLTA